MNRSYPVTLRTQPRLCSVRESERVHASACVRRHQAFALAPVSLTPLRVIIYVKYILAIELVATMLYGLLYGPLTSGKESSETVSNMNNLCIALVKQCTDTLSTSDKVGGAG